MISLKLQYLFLWYTSLKRIHLSCLCIMGGTISYFKELVQFNRCLKADVLTFRCPTFLRSCANLAICSFVFSTQVRQWYWSLHLTQSKEVNEHFFPNWQAILLCNEEDQILNCMLKLYFVFVGARSPEDWELVLVFHSTDKQNKTKQVLTLISLIWLSLFLACQNLEWRSLVSSWLQLCF